MTNTQKKHKFNIIDVLIILVVLAIAVVMYYYVSARNTVASALEVDVQYTVELKQIHRDYIDKIKIGDNVVETVRDQQIGKVVDVDLTPAGSVVIDGHTGESYVSYYPPINDADETELEYEYYNVRVTIEDTFKKSDTGYVKNAFTLNVGEKVSLRVPGFVNEGYCVYIKEVQ